MTSCLFSRGTTGDEKIDTARGTTFVNDDLGRKRFRCVFKPFNRPWKRVFSKRAPPEPLPDLVLVENRRALIQSLRVHRVREWASNRHRAGWIFGCLFRQKHEGLEFEGRHHFVYDARDLFLS